MISIEVYFTTTGYDSFVVAGKLLFTDLRVHRTVEVSKYVGALVAVW